jgi:squalene-hopene/tetraprenyl-beta-curcumene cyclase
MATAGGCAADSGLVGQIDDVLSKAAAFLVQEQSPDGAWRSKTYGCFKDGPSLTPLILSTLRRMPPAEGIEPSYRRGVVYLAGLIRPNGQVEAGPYGLIFPVYTSANAVMILSQKCNARHLRARDAWLTYLRQRQLTEAMGWGPSDPEYGGWGFSLQLPRKPKPGQLKEPFGESNLSATTYAIGALRAAQVPAEDPAFQKALVFVQRCQNFAEDPPQRDPEFDDGGFFFIPGDPLQNKAGVAGKDSAGRERYHSYGSMTADGLRSLLRCGLPPDHPRVVAARQWLEAHFSVAALPGTFEPDREVLRDGLYYYYCWAVAHAFMALDVREIRPKDGPVRWAEELARELLRRQRDDGTWVNGATDAKEDDPLVSTPWAASALAICRKVITGQTVEAVTEPQRARP